MTDYDRRHYRLSTREAEAHYRAEYPNLWWRAEPSTYQRRPEDEQLVLLTFGAGMTNAHYLVGARA